MPILRHQCGFSASRLGDEIVRLRGDIEADFGREEMEADTCARLLDGGLRLAGALSMQRAQDPAIRDALRVASRAGVGLFAPLGAQGVVQIELWEGSTRTLAPSQPTRSTDAVNWLKGFCAALVIRDQYALAAYSSAPLDLVATILAPEEMPALDAAVAFRAYRVKNPETPSLIASALRSNDPDAMPASRADWVLDVIVPALAMLYRIVEGREGAFNEELDKALRLYSRHCARDAQRSSDPAAMIALFPLALACRAYDIGIDIFVKSDYIPQSIIEDQSGLP